MIGLVGYAISIASCLPITGQTLLSFNFTHMATTQNKNSSSSKTSGKSNRGFAAMDEDRQREIASEGGKAAHTKGTAHEFTSEEARQAASKRNKK